MSPQNTPFRLIKQPSLQRHARDSVTAYRHRQQIAGARDRVYCVATANRHALHSWRVEADRADVCCRGCGAGAAIDLELAVETISADLHQPCQGVVSAGMAV